LVEAVRKRQVPVIGGGTGIWSSGTAIADPKAYLTTAVARLGINYLCSVRVRRETYLGNWLLEPVVVPGGPGPAEHAELADSLFMAFLVLLETLSPVERRCSYCARCA
jgi:DNA-directed RNA polymerase specialized sigma24 family protein